MPPRILQKWNYQTHEDILVVVLDHFCPKVNDWRDIVTVLRERFGHTFTEGALQYVYYMLSQVRHELASSDAGLFYKEPSKLLSVPTHFSPQHHFHLSPNSQPFTSQLGLAF